MHISALNPKFTLIAGNGGMDPGGCNTPITIDDSLISSRATKLYCIDVCVCACVHGSGNTLQFNNLEPAPGRTFC